MSIYKTSQYFLSFMIMAALAGCASFSEKSAPSTVPQAISSDNRVQTLSNIENWDLNALIAIRNQAKNNADSATLNWRQDRQGYSILLWGPLGTNTVKLRGGPGHVVLEKSNGQHFSAPSPEILLAEQTGWELPVSNLYYWVRGLAVPNMPAEKQFDASKRLTELTQQGWTVRFLRYTSVNQIDLPDKISLDNPLLNVKIIIKQWRL